MKITIAMPQSGTTLFKEYMKGKYKTSLKKAGAEVRWIELDNVDRAVSEALQCDGLLLQGGADVAPELYGEERTERCGSPDVKRDQFEPELYKAFIKARKPVLAICRGIQLVTAVEGGKLYQDISDIQKCSHMSVFTRSRHCHNIKIDENSRLFEIFGLTSVPVNSMHHQAVKKSPGNFTVSAVSEDGFVECIEKNDYPFCIGVQWHPEHMYSRIPLQRKIFDAFVKACSEESFKLDDLHSFR